MVWPEYLSYRLERLQPNYKGWIEDNLSIIDKQGELVPFTLNPVQAQYMTQDSTGRDIVLKARQQGFSSLILGRFTADFILKENSQSVVVADVSDNAIALLERVKFYVKSFGEKTGVKIPLKYNSKYELFNELMNTKYTIGTAENTEFGRSRTITNLHLSEAAFYRNFKKLLSGALQAVVPDGYVVIETTANGFNEFREYWYESKGGETGFTPLFYPGSHFYSQEFLEKKKMELKDQFTQEYPETDVEAFITSGKMYFESEAMQWYLTQIKEVDPVYAL